MSKKRRKLKMWPIVALFCLVIFGILIYCIYDIFNSLKSNEAKEIKVLNTIEKYDYTLNENDSMYVSEIFEKLKSELDNEVIDEKQYATYISQIFLADFYNLNSALNKNDIGGKQFVYTSYQKDFEASAKDSVYRYVENNIYGDRNQNLPVVNEVIVDKIEQKMYNSDTVVDSKAFYVDATIMYKEDLGYAKKASLILVHDDFKLQIAVMK